MALIQQKPEPWLLRVRSSETFIVSVIGIAMFTDTLIYTIVSLRPSK